MRQLLDWLRRFTVRRLHTPERFTVRITMPRLKCRNARGRDRYVS